MVAAEIQADLLILMSDVDGIYNKPPWEDGAKLMSTYTTNDRDQIQFGKKSKVSFALSETPLLSDHVSWETGTIGLLRNKLYTHVPVTIKVAHDGEEIQF